MVPLISPISSLVSSFPPSLPPSLTHSPTHPLTHSLSHSSISARAPSSPRSSGKDKLGSFSGKQEPPAVTDKVQIKDMAFWKKGTFESAPPQKANVVFSRDIETLRAEYGLMGMMCSGAMKRRVAEPLGMLISTPCPHCHPNLFHTPICRPYLTIEDMKTNGMMTILFLIVAIMSDWSN